MNKPISAARDSRLVGDGNGALGRPRGLPTLGFLVADAMLRLLSANDEAIATLSYPETDGRPQSLAEAFERKLRRHLLRGRGFVTSTALQFNSGRRTYFCRAFHLEAKTTVPGPAVVMVLERGLSQALALSQLAVQFCLTRREQEAVAMLLQGLANKEMAERMAISPNTVKALLRMVMVKMHVSSRSEVVATVLGLVIPTTSEKMQLAHQESGIHRPFAP